MQYCKLLIAVFALFLVSPCFAQEEEPTPPDLYVTANIWTSHQASFGNSEGRVSEWIYSSSITDGGASLTVGNDNAGGIIDISLSESGVNGQLTAYSRQAELLNRKVFFRRANVWADVKFTEEENQAAPSKKVTYDEDTASPSYGYPLTYTDGSGRTTYFEEYSGLGDLTKWKYHENGTSEEASYDAIHRENSRTFGDGSVTTTTYSGAYPDTSTDELGTTYAYEYCTACGALPHCIKS